MLVSEEAPRPADARLDLIENQEETVAVADVAQAPEERGRDHPDAALALDRLDHDRAGSRPDRGLDRGEIGDRDLVEPVDLRPETVEIFRLAAGGDGGERAAMKGAFEGQNAIALGMAVDRLAPPRHLDRRLVRLRARIGEEDEIGEGRVREPASEPFPFRVLIEVRDVPKLRALADQGLHEMRMRMADRGHRDAGAEVEVTLARARDEPAPLASLEGDLGPGVSRDDR